MAGGPPRDGIPAIDSPVFHSIQDAQAWLEAQEPVIALAIDGEARAYPLQIMTWHEITNDVVGGVPITVTFCPLCYSAIAFDRRVNGEMLSFGVSGLLRYSDMVMYDRQTESLWQQLNGTAIVGELVETALTPIPAQLISFEQFATAYPQGLVLSRETGHQRSYGRNPYVGYDNIDERPYLFRGPYDDRVPPMAKVVTVSIGEQDKAYPHSVTRKKHVIHDELGGQPLVVFHGDGAVSALDQSSIASSKEIGSVGVFDPRLDDQQLVFQYQDGFFVDTQTQSIWDITGQAIEGALKGKRLHPIPHGNYFSFAWFAFKPNTALYQPEQ